MDKQSDVSWEVSTPRSPIPLVRFENAEASAVHTLHSGLNPGDARGGSLIDRGVPVAPPFVGSFCRSIGVQSTTQP